LVLKRLVVFFIKLVSCCTLLCVSDGSGALFLRGVLAGQKKAGTYSTTRSFYGGSRPNLNTIVLRNLTLENYCKKKLELTF